MIGYRDVRPKFLLRQVEKFSQTEEINFLYGSEQ